MRIHLYFTDKTPAYTMNESLSGLSTFEKKHSGQLCVRKIVDVQFCSHPDYEMQILCEPLIPYEPKVVPSPDLPTPASEQEFDSATEAYPV